MLGSVLSVAGLAYVMRITLMNMAAPVRSVFSMEILDPGERSTQVGLQQALSGVVMGGAAYLGAQMMNRGDFRGPFRRLLVGVRPNGPWRLIVKRSVI